MDLKDYIFYRMYLIYVKNNDFGRATCILYFMTFEFMLVFPFFAPIGWRLDVSNTVWGISLTSIAIFLFLVNLKRYHKKSTLTNILKKYKNNPYTNIIKDWMLNLIAPIIAIWFILGTILVMKLVNLLFEI